MTMAGLTTEQLYEFDSNGMICIPDFLGPSEVSLLLTEAHSLLDKFDIDSHPKTKFSTEQDNHIGDEYFLNSSNNISYFFDTDVFDNQGNLKYPKSQAINKIGHGLHMKNALFHKIAFDPKVKAIMRSLGYKDPRLLQSMLIFKQPARSSDLSRDNEVPSHQDGTFLYTDPQSAIGFWYALEDCTLENGCLWYNPGSHKKYPINHRFVKVDKGRSGCNMITVGDGEVPKDLSFVPVECKAGSLILIHNSVVHKSEKNRSEKSRFAFAFHVIDGVTKYDEFNWLQVPPGEKGGTEFSKLYSE
jgi:hypothetical protein